MSYVISVVKTSSGNYNVIGTSDNAFILQGNLTKTQLEELLYQAAQALREG